MIITFPCEPGRSRLGTPDRAEPCRCPEGALLSEPGETCLRCGHLEKETIDATWAKRALAIARREKPAAQPLAVAA